MKYLKTFESNNESILSDIKDMFLELEDCGFELGTGEGIYDDSIGIHISKGHVVPIPLPRDFNFTYDEVEDFCERLYDYMDQKGYSHDNKYMKIDKDGIYFYQYILINFKNINDRTR